MTGSAVVVSMKVEHIPAVVALHQETLPESRTTLLGGRFLRAMYVWFLENQGPLALVSERDGQVLGFLAGALGGYGRRLFRRTLPVILWSLAMRPRLWVEPRVYRLWSSYLKGLLPVRASRAALTSPRTLKASVASVVVSTRARGQGIGSALLQEFELRARGAGASMLSLSVERANSAARRTYESAGWGLVSESDELGCYYEKPLGG